MKHVYRISLQVLGFILLLLGIIGLFVPVLQGILCLLAGLYVFTLTSPSFKSRFDIFLVRFPRIKRHVDKNHARMNSFFNVFSKKE